MIDWDLIPEHIVAIDSYSDFSGGNFYTLSKYEGKLLRVDDASWSVDVLLSVRPSAVVEVVSTLSKKIDDLEFQLSVLEKKIKDESNDK